MRTLETHAETEIELVERCQQGDMQAFNRLVMQYQHLVYNFLYRLSPRTQQVEDLAQDVFIRVYRSIKKLKEPRQFKSWLHRIAVHVYIDEQRRRKTMKERVVSDDCVVDIQPDPNANPGEQVVRQELQDQLQAAIDRLPEEFRLAIVLREIQELSYEEIASVLTCSIGTVRSRIFRGRQLLRNMLEEYITA
jgi:RNA polymerase sigma-70 factor (ECF subfamily)